MKPLAYPPVSEQVFALCEEWVSLLAASDYSLALALLAERTPPRWTPELVESLISNYGSVTPHRSGRIFRASPLSEATGQPALSRLAADPDDDTCDAVVHDRFPIAIYVFRTPPAQDPSRIGWVHLDYPLDGAWSDLSSIFTLRRDGESCKMLLDSIEVM